MAYNLKQLLSPISVLTNVFYECMQRKPENSEIRRRLLESSYSFKKSNVHETANCVVHFSKFVI